MLGVPVAARSFLVSTASEFPRCGTVVAPPSAPVVAAVRPQSASFRLAVVAWYLQVSWYARKCVVTILFDDPLYETVAGGMGEDSVRRGSLYPLFTRNFHKGRFRRWIHIVAFSEISGFPSPLYFLVQPLSSSFGFIRENMFASRRIPILRSRSPRSLRLCIG